MLISDNNVDRTIRNEEAHIYFRGDRIGSSATQVEYRMLKYTSEGKTLFTDDFTQNSTKWNPHNGSWKVGNGVYTQSSSGTEVTSTAGDPSWNKFTAYVTS